jgi:hypothetical protein
MHENAIDHDRIDLEVTAERYVLGQLPPAEAQRFEEHFLDCAECLERVELAERLRHGLARASVRRAAASAAAAGSLLAVWLRLARRQRLALVAAGLALLALAAALPTALLRGRTARLDRQLAAARAQLAARPSAPAATRPAAAPPAPGSGTPPLSRPGAEEAPQARATAAGAAGARPAAEGAAQARPAAEGAPQVRPAAEGAAQAELRRLAGELAARGAEAARLAADLRRARAPQVNVPLLALSLVRAAPDAPPLAAPAVALPPAAAWLVVSLEPSDPGFPRYRVTLAGPGGAALWQGDDLVPTAAGLLSLSLPRTLLAPGDFRLRVEGLPNGRAAVPAGEFPFHVM